MECRHLFRVIISGVVFGTRGFIRGPRGQAEDRVVVSEEGSETPDREAAARSPAVGHMDPKMSIWGLRWDDVVGEGGGGGGDEGVVTGGERRCLRS